MDESDHCKEVYAHYGLAMYGAQCLERSIIQLLIYLDFFKKHAVSFESQEQWERDFDKFEEAVSQKTMGRLIGALKKLNVINTDIENLLSVALKKRNWLAHAYFFDRATDFVNEKGRKKMIEELESCHFIFRQVENTLEPINNSIQERYGITEQMLEEAKKQLINNGN